MGIVTNESHMRGTEGPIHQADPIHRETHCFPGNQVREITRKLPSLACPSDHYPHLFVQVSSDEVAE